MSYRFFEPYLVVGLVYYVLVMILTFFMGRLEKWVNRSERG